MNYSPVSNTYASLGAGPLAIVGNSGSVTPTNRCELPGCNLPCWVHEGMPCDFDDRMIRCDRDLTLEE